MTEGGPDDLAWLSALVERSALLPDPQLQRHWRRVLPWLSRAQRYELAATLLSMEQVVRDDEP
jgi:hypothetical protein